MSGARSNYFVIVTPFEHCKSHGTPVREWIAGVSLGSFSNDSGPSGYSDFTDKIIAICKEAWIRLGLTPG